MSIVFEGFKTTAWGSCSTYCTPLKNCVSEMESREFHPSYWRMQYGFPRESLLFWIYWKFSERNHLAQPPGNVVKGPLANGFQIGEDKETGEVKRVKRKAQTKMWDSLNDRIWRPQNKVFSHKKPGQKKKNPKKLVETANSKCWTYGKNNLQLNG